jgi:hypothetical protein
MSMVTAGDTLKNYAEKTPKNLARFAPANRRPRYEPRKHWPPASGCAAPYAEPRSKNSPHVCGKYKRLPVVQLREVA